MDYRKEILIAALEARKKEVIEYQINIDNFVLAIEKIGDDTDLQVFKQTLKDLLDQNRVEQKKAKIMLEVIKEQIE
jgi:hypothetical protein